MPDRTNLWIIASAAAVLAMAACGEAQVEPSGEIRLAGAAGDIAVGERVDLSWSAEGAERVFVRLSVNGEESTLLDPAGHGPAGSKAFVVDAAALPLEDSDSAALKFQLLAQEAPGGDYEVLDETRTLNVARTGAGDD